MDSQAVPKGHGGAVQRESRAELQAVPKGPPDRAPVRRGLVSKHPLHNRPLRHRRARAGRAVQESLLLQLGNRKAVQKESRVELQAVPKGPLDRAPVQRGLVSQRPLHHRRAQAGQAVQKSLPLELGHRKVAPKESRVELRAPLEGPPAGPAQRGLIS